MANLFIRDIDLIKHNNKEIILMKLDGEVIYKRNGFYVEYRVNNNLSGSLIERCLPLIYSDENNYSSDGYTRIEIIKLDGTTTSDTSTDISQIKKIKLWYPKTTHSISFENSEILEDESFIGPLTEVNYINSSNLISMNSMFYGCNNLTLLDLSNWSTNNVADMSYMFALCWSLGALDLTSFNTSNVANMKSMFSVCDGLTSLDLSNFDTANVTDMNGMFQACKSLTLLDVSSFDTNNVTDMSYMFYDCNLLTSLDVSNFNTSKVTDMSEMFYYCYGLPSLDVSGFNTGKVTKMNDMFNYCYGLTSLDVSGFDTSNVINMSNMFYKCWNLTELDVSNWIINDKNGVYMEQIFAGCSKLKTIKGVNNLVKNGFNKFAMFYDCKALESLDFSDWTNSGGETSYMFGGCTGLKELNLSNLEISEDDNAFSMVADCHSLHTLRLDNCGKSTISKIINSETFPTNKITKQRLIFCKEENAEGLTAPENWYFIFIDTTDTYYIGKFKNNSNITMVNTIVNESHSDLSSMFENCTSLEFVYTENWNTVNVTNMASMFNYCYGLTSLDVSKFDTANVTNMNNMFYNCFGLTSLDVSSWNVSNVSNMKYMFANCSGLTELNLSSWNPANYITSMSAMFYGCSNLKTLNLGGFDMSEATSLSSVSMMFSKCSALENFEPPKNINRSLNFGDCTSLSHDSLMKIINNLATISSTTTLYLGATNLEKLNGNEMAIAIQKGWTLA